MHTVIILLPFAGFLALAYANDRWSKRPSVRARWATRSLRDKIARTIRTLRIAATLQAALIALWLALWLAGILSPGGLIVGAVVSGIYLAADLNRLRHALAARRAYNDLGPLAYVAEVQHAFGGTS